MNTYRRSFLFFLLLLFLLQIIIIYAIKLNRPIYGDEVHFVPTVLFLGKNLTLQTIKHYPEMNTPLGFVLYGLWGRAFGFELPILRTLSIILAIITYIAMHRLFFTIFNDSLISVLSTIFIAVNPYMIGLNIFVYTDMLGILFLVTACLAIYHNRWALFMISSAAAVLCRQYLIFLTASALMYYFFQFCKDRNHLALKMMLSGIVSLIPFLCLVLLWKGLGPDNDLRRINLSGGFSYHPSFLTLYISQMFIYLLPVVLICWRSFFRSRTVLGICLLISPIYWLFPVRPSKVLIDADIHTVGFLHRTLRYLFNNTFYEDVGFYLLFYFGLAILIYFVRDTLKMWKQKDFNYFFFLYLSIFMFLLVQPFSYISWEKYFMPIMPLIAIQILRTRFREKTC